MGKPDWNELNKRLDEIEKNIADIKKALSDMPLIGWKKEG